MQLQNKIAVVTGSGSGIGRATAIKFAREGAKVVVADKDGARADTVVAEIQAIGGVAKAYKVDVSKAGDVEGLMAFTVRAWDRIDILVNNAGYGIAATILETSEVDWEDLMAVNVKGVFLSCKHALPYMIAHGGGSIVNTASAQSRSSASPTARRTWHRKAQWPL